MIDPTIIKYKKKRKNVKKIKEGRSGRCGFVEKWRYGSGGRLGADGLRRMANLR